MVPVLRRRGYPFGFMSWSYYCPSVRLKVKGCDVQEQTLKRPWNTASVLVTILLLSASISLILYVPISYTTSYETSVGISSVTSLQATNYIYVTSYWTSEITPYAYFGSFENQAPMIMAIIALSIIAALSLLLISIRGAHKAHYPSLSLIPELRTMSVSLTQRISMTDTCRRGLNEHSGARAAVA